MILACGTCGLSMLSSAFPPFDLWSYLLLPALLVYVTVQIREGAPVAQSVLASSLKAVGLFVASMAFLAAIIWPVLVFTVISFFSLKALSKDRLTRHLSILMLVLYVGSGVYQFAAAKYQGPQWQLTRLKAGGPGHSYFSETAKNGVFTDRELVEYLMGEQKTVARNSRELLTMRIQRVKSLDELKELDALLQNALKLVENRELKKSMDRRMAELVEAQGGPKS